MNVDDIKAEARRGLEILGTISDDIEQANAIFTRVLDHIENPGGREPQHRRSSESRAGGTSLSSSSVKRGRKTKDEEACEKNRRRANKRRSPGRSVRRDEPKKNVTRSSSGSGSSSCSESTSHSSIFTMLNKPSHDKGKLMSVGGSGPEGGMKRKQRPLPPQRVKDTKSKIPELKAKEGAATKAKQPNSTMTADVLREKLREKIQDFRRQKAKAVVQPPQQMKRKTK